MFEPRHAPLAPRARFLRRVATNFGLAMLVIGGSLAWGMWGYRYFEHLRWIDAFLNAAMLLGGIYALYAVMVVLVAASILIAPMFHRFIHRFHLEQREDEKRRAR